MKPILYTDVQVAKLLNISESKLRQDRHKGRGLRYVRIGKCIRYITEDIEKFIEKNCIQPSKG